jgi:glutathione S-transferase
MDTPFKVLGRRTSNNVQKVLWLLDELGVAFEQEDYGGPFGKTRTPQYLALNPNGTVPTLVEGGFALWESNTILRYLAARNQSAFSPADPAQRALADQWMDWQLGALSPAFRPVYIGLVRDRRDPAALEEEVRGAARLFDMLNERLGAATCVAGPTLSLADFALGPMVHRWMTLRLDRGKQVHLQRYHDALLARPAFLRQVASVALA